MRAGVGEPVPIGWPAAEVAALLAGLRGHRGADPDPGAGDLALGLQAQRHHCLLVVLGAEVDPAADLRRPQLDPVVLEQRRHRRELAPAERPLVLPDHYRVPAALGVSQFRDQRGGLRAPCPGQRPALADVEELRHDLSVPGHQRSGLVTLPDPRCHWVLVVLGRHPPVEHEPQPAAVWLCGTTPSCAQPRPPALPPLVPEAAS
jgi:hypothetical protein